MKKKAKLLWIIFILFISCTIIILLMRNSAKENVSTRLIQHYYMKLSSTNPLHLKKKFEHIEILENYFDDTKEIILARIKHIEEICPKIEKKTSIPESTILKIVLDKKHNISWCPIFKAASSSWMKNFALLSGVLTNTTMKLVEENLIQLNNIVKQVFSKVKNFNETVKEISESKKFMIVRHPFERLLSAYRDKLERIEGREYYYKRFGRHIVIKYRPNETIRNRTSLVPSFREFLQFIVREKYFDEHWIPFYEACEPCLVKYNYILKFEHLKKETLYLLKETGLFEYLDSYNEIRNANPYGATTNAVAKHYFKDIPKSLIEQVYKLYEKDFLLFSYLPDDYYLMSKDNKSFINNN